MSRHTTVVDLSTGSTMPTSTTSTCWWTCSASPGAVTQATFVPPAGTRAASVRASAAADGRGGARAHRPARRRPRRHREALARRHGVERAGAAARRARRARRSALTGRGPRRGRARHHLPLRRAHRARRTPWRTRRSCSGTSRSDASSRSARALGAPTASPSSSAIGSSGRCTVSCGECDRCTRGIPQQCRSLAKYGHERVHRGWELSGGFATHVQLRVGTDIVRVSEDVPSRVLAPASCATATAVAALDAASARVDLDGALVLVTGAGLIGLTVAAMAVEAGAEVIVSDPDASRRAFARGFGAVAVDPAARSTSPERLDMTLAAFERRGLPEVLVAVETSGAPSAVRTAIGSLGVGGVGRARGQRGAGIRGVPRPRVARAPARRRSRPCTTTRARSCGARSRSSSARGGGCRSTSSWARRIRSPSSTTRSPRRRRAATCASASRRGVAPREPPGAAPRGGVTWRPVRGSIGG